MRLKSTIFCTILLIVVIQRVTGMLKLKNLLHSGNKDYAGDIEYKLRKTELFGQKISSNDQAKRFKIGKNCLIPLGTRKDRATCTRLMADQYKDSFLTRIAEVSGDNIVKANYIRFRDFYDHFVILGREVWKCTIENKEPESQFYRIVHVIQGVEEIHKLYYVDGIQVLYKFQLPAMQQSNTKRDPVVTPVVTSVVEEIKYLDITDWSKQLKFEGMMEYYYPDGDFKNEKLSMFEAVYVDERDGICLPGAAECSGQKDINQPWLEKGQSRTSEIHFGIGHDLMVGQTWSEEIGTSTDEARCVRIAIHGDKGSSLLPDLQLYNYHLKEWFRNYGKPKYQTVLAEYFTVTKHQFWNCTIEGDKETFTRVETELIGRIRIREATYYNGISLWKFKLDELIGHHSVKIKSVHYCKIDQPDSYLKYTGVLNLINHPEEQSNNNDAEYKVKYSSSTNKIEDKTDSGRVSCF